MEFWELNGIRCARHLKSAACRIVQWVQAVSKPDDLSWILHDPHVRKRELAWEDCLLMSKGAHNMHGCVWVLVYEDIHKKINKQMNKHAENNSIFCLPAIAF